MFTYSCIIRSAYKKSRVRSKPGATPNLDLCTVLGETQTVDSVLYRATVTGMADPKLQKHSGDYEDETRPHPLSMAEWRELMAIPAIRWSWGLETDETPENFAKQVYAAKFHFVSGSPGYVGDLYIVQGDTLTGDVPFVLLRGKDGKLAFAY